MPASGAKRILLVGHGYVGSFLNPVLQASDYRVSICDQEPEKLADIENAFVCRYQDLSESRLAEFDVILWFAGHSSVPAAVADPEGAVANNCFDLFALARRKPETTRLIYASTASLYSVQTISPDFVPPALDESQTRLRPANAYDCSKVAFDALASCFAPGTTGLRLGTVCGASRNLRPDLVFNAMNRSAIREGEVRVANRHAYRSLLFLDDLAYYILKLVAEERPLPHILNVGSISLSLGELADEIAEFHGVPVIDLPDSSTYSFRTDCSLVQRLCGTPPATSISEQCRAFTAALADSASL